MVVVVVRLLLDTDDELAVVAIADVSAVTTPLVNVAVDSLLRRLIISLVPDGIGMD